LRLGVYFGWHVHGFEELLALVELAEELGYDAAFVDGDATLHPGRETLDGWTVTMALLARTRRIGIGSLRIVHHWTAARLAQAVASAERIAPRRLRFLVSIGGRPIDARFGLPVLPVGERIRWLDETLDAARALWRGETVTRAGRYVQLAGASLCPAPPAGRVEIAIAAKGPACRWWRAMPTSGGEPAAGPFRVFAAAASRHRLRDDRARTAADHRSMLLFLRIAEHADPAPLPRRVPRLNPWFGFIPDDEAAGALIMGDPATRATHRVALPRARDQRPTSISSLPAKPAASSLRWPPRGSRDTPTPGP
jgi:alkanesulfonate monooxygenase SsuD/methylene tetrahydromethanopterin reductase-like flavin-dependent oxidoreductase (luciferase family)